MPISLYPRCWAGRDDCMPVHCIDATDEELTPEQYETMDYWPNSFVCCGCVKMEARTVPQDSFRICWGAGDTLDMADHDEQDLTHLIAVASMGLAVLTTRKTMTPSLTVMTPEGLEEVQPMQFDESGDRTE